MRRETAAIFLWFIAGLIAASGQSGTYIFSVGGIHYSQSDFSLHYKLCAPYGWPTYKLTCSAYLALVSQDRPTSAEVGLACKTNFSS